MALVELLADGACAVVGIPEWLHVAAVPFIRIFHKKNLAIDAFLYPAGALAIIKQALKIL
jgi:hypothetical protein